MKATRVKSIDQLYRDDAIDGGYCCTTDEHGNKQWYVRTPNGHFGNISKHDVTENEDGTITVSPSILVSTPRDGEIYHGFLVNDEWNP